MFRNKKSAAGSGQTEIERLKTVLREADAVVLGAGAGMSTAARFEYSGARFQRYFSDLAARYGYQDM